MSCWNSKRETMGDDPPYLAVGTEVSAKYKGAFCEAKIRKVVRSVKCKVIYKQGLGGATVTDDQIKGTLRAGSVIEVKHPEKKEFVEASISKIQDCSQYTVVFDDGDITTLRRSALCLKSGRHFAESETLDQLPLTHPEHFCNPVIGNRRGRRNRNGGEESSDEDEPSRQGRCFHDEKEADIGRVVCVEGGDKKKQKDNWFPGLVVAPTAQDTVRIHVKDEYLVRSFKDGRYYTVPKKEASEFTREIGLKVDNHTLRAAVEKALMFLDRDELPPHWDRELLFGLVETTATDSDPGFETDSSDDEPREEKDHFVAQLYKFMDDRGTPINKGPTISSRDVDLYRLFKVVHNLGGYNRVTNHNHWKIVSHKIGFGQNPVTVNLVKHAYKKFLHSFEEFYRKLGCTMVNHPRINRNRNKTGRRLIRDRDRATPVNNIKSEQKEKGVDKEDDVLVPILPNLQLSTPDLKVKIEIEETIIARDLLKETQRTKSIDVKDKGKRIESATLIKIKDEKPEECEKSISDQCKELPKKAKTRKSQTKFSGSESKKEDTAKESSPKGKKKRLFSKLSGKKEKVTKVSKPGLTSTRQKRTMKDRMKAFVDKFKMKITKELPPLGLQENSDRVGQGAKLKVKEEIGSTSIKAKKDDFVFSGIVNEEKKKGGRKRKDRPEGIEDDMDILPTYKKICVGDKLKVYYGPTHESKVTYEAKVLSIRGEGCDVMYFVHYTGWNTRYDEWIKYSRIADNLSWTPGRLPKKQNMSPKCGKRKCGTVKGESGGRSTPSSGTSNSSKTKARSIPRLKSSVSESEAEYDSENTDIEQSNVIKGRTIKYPEDTKKDEDLPDDNVMDTLPEKNRGKRKFSVDDDDDDDDSTQIEKKKNDDKLKNETIDECENDVDLPPDIKSVETKIELDDKINEIKMKNCVERRSSQEFMVFVESNIVKVSSDNLKFEETESDSEEKKTPKKKLDKPTTDVSCNESLRKLKTFDMKLESEVENKSDSDISSPQEEENQAMKFNTDKECYKKKKIETLEEECTGRDFDLNQIRSELKGIDKTLKVAVGLLQDHKDDEEDSNIKSDVDLREHSDAEDVYEFKEPEPFCFEARKVNDDKSKLSRRSVGRILDDIQSSPVKKKCKEISSPLYAENKSTLLLEEQEKNVFDVDISVQELEPCEETFDKICASPLRAAADETCTEMKLFNDLPAEDDDELDEDSEDRLVISEHESDSEALFTHQYRNHEEIFPTEIRSIPTSDENVRFSEYNSTISNDIGLEDKDNFIKEDNEQDDEEEEDDDTENEAINNVIQRVISQDMTDESNEEDLLSAPASPQVEPNDLENDVKNKVPELIISVETEVAGMVPSIAEVTSHNLDTQIVNSNIPTIDAPETSSDGYDVLKNTIVTLEAKDLNMLSKDEKKYETEYEITETVLGSGDSNLVEPSDTIEIHKEDISGGNLVSLLCEETIPGSPAPQIEPVDAVEEKIQEISTGPSFNNEILDSPEESLPPSVVQNQDSPVKEAALVMDNTPPTTPESPLSSESVSPRGDRSGSTPPLDNESTKSHRDSEPEAESFPEPKENTDDESRMEEGVTKVENARISKKGRRTRKRSEDTGKRKFPRRHHGSDSDDTSENSITTSNRLDVLSSRPCKYNYVVQFGPEIEANQRIAVLTQALQDLRKTYTNVKAELASIDRRRKKLRKRERENALSRLH